MHAPTNGHGRGGKPSGNRPSDSLQCTQEASRVRTDSVRARARKQIPVHDLRSQKGAAISRRPAPADGGPQTLEGGQGVSQDYISTGDSLSNTFPHSVSRRRAAHRVALGKPRVAWRIFLIRGRASKSCCASTANFAGQSSKFCNSRNCKALCSKELFSRVHSYKTFLLRRNS